MDDCVDVELAEDGLHGVAVGHVGAHEGEALRGLVAHDLVDAVEDLLARVGQVVHHHDLVAGLEQYHHGVAADEAAATGHEDAAVLGCFFFAHTDLPIQSLS